MLAILFNNEFWAKLLKRRRTLILRLSTIVPAKVTWKTSNLDLRLIWILDLYFYPFYLSIKYNLHTNHGELQLQKACERETCTRPPTLTTLSPNLTYTAEHSSNTQYTFVQPYGTSLFSAFFLLVTCTKKRRNRSRSCLITFLSAF